jgi:hypothetical protein
MAGGQGDTAGEVLARLRADVDALLRLDLTAVDGATGPGLHRELGTMADQVRSMAARVLARIEADGRWQAGGDRTFGQWVARRQGASVGAARREAALGRALDESLPATARAVAGGHVSLEHAQVLARHAVSSEARKRALASTDPRMNEAHLARQAARQGADEFRKTVQRWAHAVDASTAELEHEAACEREYVTMTRRPDGVALQGLLTHEHGEAVAVALRSVAGVPAADDTRSRDQRQAAALVDAARLVLDRGLAGAGQTVRPHLSVTVSWESLQRQVRRAAETDGQSASRWLPHDWLPHDDEPWEVHAPAELADGTPLPPTLLARLACDGEISRIVFGPEGDVLDLGRSQRTYTGQQRRAVIARDRHCQYPGCSAPPNLGEVHHVEWWERDDGPTSVENGILVCWHHHDLVHRRNLRITRAAGRWRFARHDGVPLTDGRAPMEARPPMDGEPPGGEPPGSEPPGSEPPGSEPPGSEPPGGGPPQPPKATDRISGPRSRAHQDALALSA